MKFSLKNDPKAHVANNLIWGDELRGLSVTAWKILIYVAAHHQTIPGIDRTIVEVTFRELFDCLRPGVALIAGSDYQTMHHGLDMLTSIVTKRKTKWVRETHVLVSDWRHDSKAGKVKIWLSASALEQLALDHEFAEVALRDASRISDPRSFGMFLLACQFHKISDPEYRTVKLEAIKQFFGMDYGEWRRLNSKLSFHVDAVNKRTRFRLTLIPIRQEGQVIAIRFDVKSKGLMRSQFINLDVTQRSN